MACTVVQTPQMRWVKAQASRGSRPFRISSMPRNMVDDDQASLHDAAVDLGLDPEMPFDPGDGIDDDVRHDWPPFFSSVGPGAGPPRPVSRAAGWCSGVAPALAEGHDAVGGEGRAHADRGPEPDLVDARADAEAGHARQVLVEGRHLVPEVRLGAADAGVAAADRPVGALVPADVRAVLEGDRALAAHLVEAVAGAVALVAPGLDVLAGVEVRAPLAVVVDRLAVGEQRPAARVERRPALEGQVVDDERGQVLDVDRAGREVDQVLDARAPRRRRPSAPVGFGAAAGRPPKAAQVPMAMVAAALPQTSRAICSAERPPIVQ